MKLIFSIFLLFLALSGQAQTALRLHIGASQNYLDHEFIVDAYRERRYSAPLQGFALGLGLRYLDKGLFSVSSDIYCFQSGGKDSPEDKNSNTFQAPDRLRTTYLSAATALNISPLHGKFRLDLGVGPRFDVMIGGQNDPPLVWSKDLDREKVAWVNVGVNGVVGLYRRSGQLEYGLTATYVNRFLALTDVPSEQRGQLLLGGSYAREQSLLFCVTLAKLL